MRILTRLTVGLGALFLYVTSIAIGSKKATIQVNGKVQKQDGSVVANAWVVAMLLPQKKLSTLLTPIRDRRIAVVQADKYGEFQLELPAINLKRLYLVVSGKTYKEITIDRKKTSTEPGVISDALNIHEQKIIIVPDDFIPSKRKPRVD